MRYLQSELCALPWHIECCGSPPVWAVAAGFENGWVIAESDEEARCLWRSSGAFCGAAWFEPFGFGRGLEHPETREPVEDPLGNGLAQVGSAETVARQLEGRRRRLPVTWLFAWCYNCLCRMPH